jgi:hypothetical protein
MGKMKTKKETQDTGGISFDDIEIKTVTADDVTSRCQSYVFNGQPLEPLTPTRVNAARVIGSAMFSGKAATDETGTYPELFTDAVIAIWVCVNPIDKVRTMAFNKDKARSEMFSWWDSLSGVWSQKIEEEAVTIFASMLSDIQTVSAEIDSTGTSSKNIDTLGEL